MVEEFSIDFLITTKELHKIGFTLIGTQDVCDEKIYLVKKIKE